MEHEELDSAAIAECLQIPQGTVRRYRDSEQHPVLRAALAAGGDDRAPEGTEEKMLAALGLGTLVAVLGGTGAGGAAGAGAVGAKLAYGSAILKWGLALALAGSGVAAWVVAADAPKVPAQVGSAAPPNEAAPAVALPSARGATAAPRVVEPASAESRGVEPAVASSGASEARPVVLAER